MRLAANASFFNGNCESFPDYAQEVGIWSRVTHVEPTRRAAAFILNMDLIARNAWMAAASGQIVGPDCAMKITHVPNEYFGPEAVDPV